MGVKLRAIKKIGDIKVDEIFETSKKSAENLISQGFAEYVDTKKEKKVKDRKAKKEVYNICMTCKSFFKDADDNYKCYEHSDKTGNKLIYGIFGSSIHNELDAHCSRWAEAKPKLKVNQVSMEKKLQRQIKKEKEKERKTGKFGLLIDRTMENVKSFYEEQPFFYDKSGTFWFWKENHYEQVDEVDVMTRLDDELGFMGQTVTATLKSQYLESFKRVGRQKIPKDAPKKWIQFNDIAFSIESEKQYEVRPNYFFTNPIPWDIGDSEETPIIDKLLTEWVGKEYVRTAYEIIAYCCYTDYPIHLIICLIGSGRNGKSKFLGLVKCLLGQNNICSTELDALLSSRFESYKLYKKLACVMGETNFTVLSRTSLLKKLTGQDLIGYEYKNKAPFDDVNYAKIIIASNSLPVSDDTSEGFYRRWLILDFPNTFPEGKDILKSIPQVEYNNLCRKITKILPKLLENGKFHKQGTIEERTKRYIMASNPLSHFLETYCERGFGKYMRYSELYMMYRKYLHANKKRKIGYKEFNDVLALEGLEVSRTSKRIEGEWQNTRFVEGIELKSCDTCDTCDTYFTQIPYKENKVKIVSQKSQKSQTLVDWEELMEDAHIKCSVCGTNPTHYYYNGKYFCSVEHIDTYKVNK